MKLATISIAATALVGASNAKETGGKRLRVLSDEESAMSMPVAGIIAGGTIAAAGHHTGASYYGSSGPSFAKSSKSAKADCSIADLEGTKFALEYDFFDGGDQDYAFPSVGALTFTAPASEGKGVTKVNFCFRGSDDLPNSNAYAAVPTGFARDGGNILPIKMAKYESRVNVTDLYNESSFLGEYNCATKTLVVGYTGHFDGNAFSLRSPAVANPSLELGVEGCLPEEN